MVRVHADGEYGRGGADREALRATFPYILPHPSTKRGDFVDGGTISSCLSMKMRGFVDRSGVSASVFCNFGRFRGLWPVDNFFVLITKGLGKTVDYYFDRYTKNIYLCHPSETSGRTAAKGPFKGKPRTSENRTPNTRNALCHSFIFTSTHSIPSLTVRHQSQAFSSVRKSLKCLHLPSPTMATCMV